jgi:thiol-disulfide isomerase/thioredoxin
MARNPKPAVAGASRATSRWSVFVRGALVVAVALGLGAAWLTYRAGSAGSAPPGIASAAVVLGGAPVALTDPRRVLTSGGDWLNTRPLRAQDLRGKVILVNFWTYSCINSLRPLPYVRAWADKYRDRGLVVIGVHTPEFRFEKDIANVRHALGDLGVGYPVVLDSDYRIWNAFGNSAWPAFYFIGADGRVRRQAFGEGNYDQSERLIQTLLAEAQRKPLRDQVTPVAGVGPQVAPDWQELRSEETYVGSAKATDFASEGGLKPEVATLYRAPPSLPLNRWSLGGTWNVGDEFATLTGTSGAIAYRFHARDLNLVMAPSGGRPVRFRVRVDGADPGPNHGFDTDAQGWGRLQEPRLYQLVRQTRAVADRTFEIEFFDSGARAYVFTFG